MSAKIEAAMCMAFALRQAMPHIRTAALVAGGMSPIAKAMEDALAAWDAASALEATENGRSKA